MSLHRCHFSIVAYPLADLPKTVNITISGREINEESIH
jgi:hypothetical protein